MQYVNFYVVWIFLFQLFPLVIQEEHERTGINEVTILPDPGKPLPGDVLKTLLHALEFERKLSELCIKTEGDLPLSESKINVLPTVTFTTDGENLAEHENVNSDNANEEFLKCSAEQDTIQSSAQGSVCEEMDATPTEMKDLCLKLSSEIIGTVDPKVVLIFFPTIIFFSSMLPGVFPILTAV